MIDLTPLDVRNKRGDFKKLMRGYDPQEVDLFLELVAERLEGLVRENLQLKERTQTLQQQVTSQLGREQAVQDALVTAQELRADIKSQSEREREHILKEAETEARRLIGEAEAQVRATLRGVERRIDGAQDALGELERRRSRFLKDFRQLLERELDVVVVEEERAPLEDRPIDLDLGPLRGEDEVGSGVEAAPAAAESAPVDVAVDAHASEGEPVEEAPVTDAPEPDPGLDAATPTTTESDDTPPSAPALEAEAQVVDIDALDADPVEPTPGPSTRGAADGETTASPRVRRAPSPDPTASGKATPPAAPRSRSTGDSPDGSAASGRTVGEASADRAGRGDVVSGEGGSPRSESTDATAVVTEDADEGDEPLPDAGYAPVFAPGAHAIPSELETPSFELGEPGQAGEADEDLPDELSASMRAEALAEAQSQVVEVTGADGDRLTDVPRLEEVLAEAGADLIDGPQEPIAPAPQSAEEIAPPPIDRGRSDQRSLLYLDKDDPER